jgi:hypothetical protein
MESRGDDLMIFYVIANEDCIDCFYDFELNTFGDGICKNNLIPTRKLAEYLMLQADIWDGKVIEVLMSIDEEGILFEYENIWGNAK